MVLHPATKSCCPPPIGSQPTKTDIQSIGQDLDMEKHRVAPISDFSYLVETAQILDYHEVHVSSIKIIQ